MGAIFQYIYTRNLWIISLFFILIIVLWTIVNFCISKKPRYEKIWKILNFCGFVLIVVAVLYYTIFSRSSDIREINFRPFHTFTLAKDNVEFYRSMLMNVFLFVPFGLTLSVALSCKNRYKLLLTVVIALCFSVVLELIQYAFCLGRTEIDDVLCNTLGAFIGALPCLLLKTKN